MCLLVLIFCLVTYNIKLVVVKETQLNSLHTVYINLDTRVDRNKLISDELSKFSLNFTRFSAERSQNPFNESINGKVVGAWGCLKSHIGVIKIAKKLGKKYTLVVEDDFSFVVDKYHFYNKLDKLFTVKFDVCLLAYNTNNLKKTKYSFLYKVVDAQTTSGYIISSHYYNKFLLLLEDSLVKLENSPNLYGESN